MRRLSFEEHEISLVDDDMERQGGGSYMGTKRGSRTDGGNCCSSDLLLKVQEAITDLFHHLHNIDLWVVKALRHKLALCCIWLAVTEACPLVC